MSRSKRLKLALFGIGTLVLVVVATIVFTSLDWWRPRDHYRVRFSRSVTGLSPGARVELWGIPIGSVESIAMARDRQSGAPVVVDISVEPGTQIPVGARGTLEIEGITWIKYIDLVGGDPGGPYLEPGADIAGTSAGLTAIIERSGEVLDRFAQVMDKLDRTADNVLELTGEPNRARIASILAGADRATTSVAEAGAEIRQLASEARHKSRKLFSTLDATGRDLSRAATDARAAMAETRRAAGELHDAAADLSALSRGAGRQLQSLFARLRSAASSVQALIRSLEQNPSRLLRGGSHPEREIP